MTSATGPRTRAADGNGYTSNVINWNAAVAFEANNEFTPGAQYNTLTTGYSGMCTALFEAIGKLAEAKGVKLKYFANTRLHSIFEKDGVIHYSYATREKPWEKAGSSTTDAGWLAMPRYAIDLVAQATRYEKTGGLDLLNDQQVTLYLGSLIMQPSYKIGMFFDSPWWAQASYSPKLTGYVATPDVILQLENEKFPESYLKALQGIIGSPYTSSADFVNAVQIRIQERLTIRQEEQLLATALRNTIGPSVTDTPIRQVVYFGNNAQYQSGEPVYGILASYDDESYTSFWQELELCPARFDDPETGWQDHQCLFTHEQSGPDNNGALH